MVSATAMLRVDAAGLLLLQQCIGMGGDDRFLRQAEAQPLRKEADCRSHALGLRMTIEDRWGVRDARHLSRDKREARISRIPPSWTRRVAATSVRHAEADNGRPSEKGTIDLAARRTPADGQYGPRGRWHALRDSLHGCGSGSPASRRRRAAASSSARGSA
jgi:hypothetical protein